MSITEHKHVSGADVVPARRIEVFTGAGRRRNWTEEEKAAIVAESFADGARASQVAHRHGLTPQQLFAWRRNARRRLAEEVGAASAFVPAVVESASEPVPAAPPLEPPETKTAPIIELEITGARIWVWRDADVEMVTAIIGALKRAK